MKLIYTVSLDCYKLAEIYMFVVTALYPPTSGIENDMNMIRSYVHFFPIFNSILRNRENQLE